MATTFQRDLRRKIIESFDRKELQLLAFDLGIRWGELRGEIDSEKVASLISHQMRRGELDALIALLKEERPSAEWSQDIPLPEQQPEDDLSEKQQPPTSTPDQVEIAETAEDIDVLARPVLELSAPPIKVAIPHIVVTPKIGQLGTKWCWIPEGSFTMGGTDYDDQKPVREVTVDGFWLSRYPTTNRQYRLFVDAKGYDDQRWWTDTGWDWKQAEDIRQPKYWTNNDWNGDEHPVVGVSWYEAQAFCQWAANESGELIRLPTEAEWEKAARGTDKRIYPWGNEEPTIKHCNCNENVGKTTPVRRYSPKGDSPHGCAGMAGNVWEWTNSWYEAYAGNMEPNYYYGRKNRVVRGGCWFFDATHAHASFRFGTYAPSGRDYYVGFRCASIPSQQVDNRVTRGPGQA